MWGGFDGIDPMFATDRCAEVVAGREHKIILAEAVNEHYAGGAIAHIALIRLMADRLSQTGVLVASSAVDPPTDANVRAITEGVASVASVHLDRGFGDHDWRFVRQPWDVRTYLYATIQNEPKGPGSSVSACNDPLRLAMNRVVGIICGAGAYVLHNGAGVFGVEHTHSSGVHRTANLWEMPGIDAVMTAVRGIDRLLPEGIENWQHANTGWTPPNPVHPFDIPWAGDGGTRPGVDKAYCALGPDGRFVFAPCGVKDFADMTAKADCEIKVSHPITHDTVLEGTVVAGETVRLAGAPDQSAAYVVVGRYR